ncbi:hypothetical protein FVE85_5569 [Porphyridium purpureum]|uniref:Uncharacterized protein n=1 Tax=Porphyridium purpureum TaxID=35688 RepID=A0A5J4Z4V5_PORPP|nr:hypothetical protein FVE85_5569 [Porphyridium purpureum]|eukprot:POR8270..scf295_1
MMESVEAQARQAGILNGLERETQCERVCESAPGNVSMTLAGFTLGAWCGLAPTAEARPAVSAAVNGSRVCATSRRRHNGSGWSQLVGRADGGKKLSKVEKRCRNLRGVLMSVSGESPASAASGDSVSGTVASSSVQFMPLESNTFVFRTADGKRVVVDPWLVGTLTFGENKGFYEAEKKWIVQSESGKKPPVDVEHFDAIVLSQGLPDHAHPPTLKKLDKNIPVYAQPQAAALCRALGYKSVTEIEHADTVSVLDGKLTITAFPGALVGPPWSKRQNAYLMDFKDAGVRVFYEPHADVPLDEFRAAWAALKCDVVVLPVKRASIPALGDYPLVKGGDSALEIVQVVRPRLFIPLENDPYKSSGWLDQFIMSRGEIQEFEAKTSARNVRLHRVAPGCELDLVAALRM